MFEHKKYLILVILTIYLGIQLNNSNIQDYFERVLNDPLWFNLSETFMKSLFNIHICCFNNLFSNYKF